MLRDFSGIHQIVAHSRHALLIEEEKKKNNNKCVIPAYEIDFHPTVYTITSASKHKKKSAGELTYNIVVDDVIEQEQQVLRMRDDEKKYTVKERERE